MPQITDHDRAQWKAKGLEIDPESGLPIGTIIRNHKGEYGVIDRNCVIRISEALAKEMQSQS